jgi:protein SFI1
MSGFRPTRASPPSKRAILAAPLIASVSDISRSSAVSSSELQGLTPQDIEFLDAVIHRASPSATTFLTVFKAYNDVLNERGLDPQNEVTYYGKLLKLGTLKGKSWGDKWRMVKLQQGHTGALENRDTSGGPSNRHMPPPTRITTRLTTQRQEDDIFTLHSHQDDSEHVETEAETETGIDTPQPHRVPHSVLGHLPSPALAATNAPGLDNGLRLEYVAPPAARRQLLLATTRTFRPWDNASDATEEVRTPSTTPPSYGAAVRDTQVLKHVRRARSQVSDRPQIAPGNTKPSAKADPPRERRQSTINADDAWTKVKMFQDEKDADRFREDRLVERCWEVWKSGYNWILVHCLFYYVTSYSKNFHS